MLSKNGYPLFELDAIWCHNVEDHGVDACPAGTEGAFIGVYIRPFGQIEWQWLADYETLADFAFIYEGHLHVRDACAQPNHYYIDYPTDNQF